MLTSGEMFKLPGSSQAPVVKGLSCVCVCDLLLGLNIWVGQGPISALDFAPQEQYYSLFSLASRQCLKYFEY